LGLAAEPLSPGSLVGKIAVVMRGGATFVEKALHCQAAGAVALIIVNSANGRLQMCVSWPLIGNVLKQSDL